MGSNISGIYIYVSEQKRKRDGGRDERYKREEYSRMSKCEGSSLLHFKPKRAHSSGFRRADVLYYCSVEIAILRLHSGPRACMHRTRASLFRHSQDNALVPYIRFSHAQAIYILNQTRCKLTKFKLYRHRSIDRWYIEHISNRFHNINMVYLYNNKSIT